MAYEREMSLIPSWVFERLVYLHLSQCIESRLRLSMMCGDDDAELHWINLRAWFHPWWTKGQDDES